jgi:hypothetical protein
MFLQNEIVKLISNFYNLKLFLHYLLLLEQQRQFNTFVRDSINQLLGPNFMKTHDVQDIDAHVMDRIRSKSIYFYLSTSL